MPGHGYRAKPFLQNRVLVAGIGDHANIDRSNSAGKHVGFYPDAFSDAIKTARIEIP
jgi:hypothetical protein